MGGSFIATAHAGRLSVNEQGWRATGTVESENGEGGERMSCPVTLTGSFYARTMVKRAAAIGDLTSEVVNEERCTGAGMMRVATEGFPFRMEYESFTGTLPNISEIRTQIANLPQKSNFVLRLFAWCTYRYTPGDPHWLRYNRGARLVIAMALLRYIAGPAGCDPVLITSIGGGYTTRGGGNLDFTLI